MIPTTFVARPDLCERIFWADPRISTHFEWHRYDSMEPWELRETIGVEWRVRVPAPTVTELLEMIAVAGERPILSHAIPPDKPGGYYAFLVSWEQGAHHSGGYSETAADALALLWLAIYEPKPAVDYTIYPHLGA